MRLMRTVGWEEPTGGPECVALCWENPGLGPNRLGRTVGLGGLIQTRG